MTGATMEKVKDALHLNKSHNTTDTTTGTTTGHTTGTTHHTPGTTTTTHQEGAHGPHSTKVANAADPRIDSDMDGNRLPNQTTSGYGTADHNTLGSTGHTTGTHTTGTAGSGLTGTHHPHGTTTGHTTGTTGSGLTGNHHAQGTTTGNHVGGTGFGGGISNSTNAGPHDSNLGNKVDPRVDSDLSGSGNRHGAATGGILGASGSHATPGSGTAQNTAGPHNSDMLNKADPRVDADLDGSKTFGGNKTHA